MDMPQTTNRYRRLILIVSIVLAIVFLISVFQFIIPSIDGSAWGAADASFHFSLIAIPALVLSIIGFSILRLSKSDKVIKNFFLTETSIIILIMISALINQH